jgi:hypothetical protein
MLPGPLCEKKKNHGVHCALWLMSYLKALAVTHAETHTHTHTSCTYISLFCIPFPLPDLNLNWKVSGKINRPWDCQKSINHISPQAWELYNHNTKEFLWLFLFSQGLLEIWVHTVFILEGRKVCRGEQFQ